MIDNVSAQEILEGIHLLTEAFDKQFGDIHSRFGEIDKRFGEIDKRFDGMDKRFDGMDKRLTRVESLMVTKDYLDEKLGDLRGDLFAMTKREIGKHVAEYHTV